ncbi:hypothetical protein Hypma_006562 [Hypsizygus marmoreus]|uniref:Uncharacterized protein n=1 Tax=Hypsizygus marmoreus TaxID=39966 RepID=A0A369K1B3_HYPMA|nr:hypothetical protein Hypma_006562 [Hypsizygus marmoreus]
MSLSKDWAPPGETESDLWLERSNLDGMMLGCVAYGILFVLIVQALQSLWRKPRTGRRSWWLIIYVICILILATVGAGTNIKFIEMTYIDYRNYPGGPNAFTFDLYGTPINVADFTAFVLVNWLTDGMMVYRFSMIWNFKPFMIVFPILIFLGSVSMSISLLIGISSPGVGFWSASAARFTIAYWSLTLSLNVILTTLIVGRLWFMRRQMHSLFGKEYTRTYTSIMAMLIESASIVTVFDFIFVVSYARNSNVQNVVLPALGIGQAIGPMLIILRVANGRAWNKDTAAGTRTATGLTWNASGRKNASNTVVPLSELGNKSFGTHNTGSVTKTEGGFNSPSEYDLRAKTTAAAAEEAV